MLEIVRGHHDHFLGVQAGGVEGLAAEGERLAVLTHECQHVIQAPVVFGKEVLLLAIELEFVLLRALRERHCGFGEHVFHRQRERNRILQRNIEPLAEPAPQLNQRNALWGPNRNTQAIFTKDYFGALHCLI